MRNNKIELFKERIKLKILKVLFKVLRGWSGHILPCHTRHKRADESKKNERIK